MKLSIIESLRIDEVHNKYNFGRLGIVCVTVVGNEHTAGASAITRAMPNFTILSPLIITGPA